MVSAQTTDEIPENLSSTRERRERGEEQAERGTDRCTFRNIRTKILLKGKENCFFADDCVFKNSGDLSVSVDKFFPVS